MGLIQMWQIISKLVTEPYVYFYCDVQSCFYKIYYSSIFIIIIIIISISISNVNIIHIVKKVKY